LKDCQDLKTPSRESDNPENPDSDDVQMSREAYLDSAEFFAGVVDKIDIDGWEGHAMGEWTARDLAGHTYRSLTTILSYSSPPAETVEVETAVDFVIRATTGPNTDPRRVAELGRAAGLEIIDSPQMMVRGFFNFVREKLTDLDDDTIMKSPMGGIRLSEYLKVRTMEMVIHTLDLAQAVGQDVEPPASGMQVTLDLLSGVAVKRGLGPSLALAATGRGPLPGGFTLLG
jgi:uncharacterized protein (TIGR03083 family)